MIVKGTYFQNDAENKKRGPPGGNVLPGCRTASHKFFLQFFFDFFRSRTLLYRPPDNNTE